MARRRPLGCQEVVELVTDFLEGALTPEVRARLEEHLRGLPELRRLPGPDADHGAGPGPAAGPRGGPVAREELIASYRRWTAA